MHIAAPRKEVMVNIAILGFGTIGSGVEKLIKRNFPMICREISDQINVKYILDIWDFKGTPYEDKIVRDISVISGDPEISIVCEMMGGTKPAFEYSLECLQAGKNVVTSNKEVVANFGNILCNAARDNKVRYLYEASVGGGIPVIRTIKTAFAGCDIKEINGILNGTTNYILTEMVKKNKALADALKEAQALGYAESNPSADVDGWDACRKICILSALAFGKLIPSSAVSCTGIMDIKQSDTEIASKFGASVKLVGSSRLSSDGLVDIRVSPCLVPSDNPLSSVDGVYNGINISADAVEDITLFGQGAGMFPTAGAVLSDIIDIAKHLGKDQPLQEMMECANASAVCDEYTAPNKFYAAVECGSEKVLSDFADARILYEEPGLTAFICEDISRQSFEFLLKAGGYKVLSTFRAL